jgi:hypothetical protein
MSPFCDSRRKRKRADRESEETNQYSAKDAVVLLSEPFPTEDTEKSKAY